MDKKIETKLNMMFTEAIDHVKEKLYDHGFGIITEIDVTSTLKKKLDITYKNYCILGACNPDFAHRALQANDDVGLILPCNVILYNNEEGTVTVSSIRPTVILEVLEDSQVCKVGSEAEQALEKTFDSM